MSRSLAASRSRAALAGAPLPLALLLAAKAGVCTDRHRPQLALQLEPTPMPLRGQLARAEGRLNRTARLAPVPAVVEPAVGRERLYVGERVPDRVRATVPQLQFAQPRRIDDDPAARQLDQLAVRRRVPALVVVHAGLVH